MKALGKGILRVAVVGLGKMGLLHAGILKTLPGIELVALCDKSALVWKLCRKLSNELSVVKGLTELADLDLDAIYVTTPIASHYAITKTICTSRMARNVFVEKTLASSYDEARELCDLAQGLDGINMVGYMKRFAVTFRKGRELLAYGSLGEIESFEAFAYSSDFLGIRNNSSISSSRGGVLEDLGSHVVDLALWFFGDLEVESAKMESLGVMGPDDSVHFEVSKSNGMKGKFDLSRCKDGYRMPEVGLSIEGSEGTLKVDDDKVALKLDGNRSSSWYRQDLNDNVGFLLGAPEYFREDEYFVGSILKGDKAEPSFLTSSKVDWIIEQTKRKAWKNE